MDATARDDRREDHTLHAGATPTTEELPMIMGLMMDRPLVISDIVEFGAR